MLQIEVPISEVYNEETNLFETKTYRLDLEHSLLSLSKWESKFEKPFLSLTEKTPEETLWYVQAMCLKPDVPPEIFGYLSNENIREINTYISGKQTATWFRETPGKGGARQIITAELIYYWMTALNIPMACETWHLNRLFTLIKVSNEQNAPKKKMSQKEMLAERRALNAQRKSKLGTRG